MSHENRIDAEEDRRISVESIMERIREITVLYLYDIDWGEDMMNSIEKNIRELLFE